jgi:hypothetical protein
VPLAADWPLHQGQASMAGLRIASAGQPAGRRDCRLHPGRDYPVARDG